MHYQPKTTEAMVSSPGIYTQSRTPLGKVNFDQPAKVLSNFFNGKLLCFLLQLISYLWRSTLRPWKYLVPWQNFLLDLASIGDLNWIVIATTCWPLQCQHSLHIVSQYSALYIIYLFIYLWSIRKREVLLVRWFIIHHWLNYSGAQTVSDLANGRPFIFVTCLIIFFPYFYILTCWHYKKKKKFWLILYLSHLFFRCSHFSKKYQCY